MKNILILMMMSFCCTLQAQGQVPNLPFNCMEQCQFPSLLDGTSMKVKTFHLMIYKEASNTSLRLEFSSKETNAIITAQFELDPNGNLIEDEKVIGQLEDNGSFSFMAKGLQCRHIVAGSNPFHGLRSQLNCMVAFPNDTQSFLSGVMTQ